MSRSSRWATLCAVIALTVMPAGGGDGEPAAADLLGSIREQAAEIRDDLIEIRRQIHMHPELSGEEAETAELVAAYLRDLGLKVETGVGGHGVSAVLEGGRPGPVVAYRADMDAVPSPAVGDQPYKSRVEGVKHVCGHDAHVAIGLGIANVLSAIRDDLPGTVKFVFQPSEENLKGARAMIADGVLESPSPEAIFSIHTAPLPAGMIGCPAGVGLTGGLRFAIGLTADDGLEVVTREIVDALEAMSTVTPITGPESFAKLMENLLVEDGPYEKFVYVGARIDPGKNESSVVIRGQIRADGAASYGRARAEAEKMVKTIAGERAELEIEFAERFPDMHSDPTLVNAAIGPIDAAIGEGSAVRMHASAPFFGEDFSLFQQHIPGAMFFLGVANEEKGIAALNHFPDYDVDESAIEIGTVAMANVLLDYLRSH